MRSLLVVCLLASIASADSALPSDVAFKGNNGDWTHFEIERSLDEGVARSAAVAILPSTLSARIAWFTGDAKFEQPWRQLDRLHYLLHDLAKDKGTKRQAATCKLASAVACTKLVYAGEVTDFGATSKVAVTAALAAQIKGSGIYELEVKLDGKLVWRMKAVGYGNGAKAAWGSVPWKTTAELPPELAILSGTSGPPELGELFINLRPDLDRLGALMVVGNLDRAIVRRYLKRNIKKLNDCYDKLLLTKPTVDGELQFTFEIGADGKVTTAKTSGLDRTLERCAAAVVMGIEFPKPKDQKPVTVAFAMFYRLP